MRQRVDTALLNDDIYQRRRVMHTLGLPERFPIPQNMKDSPVTTWVQWIRDESNKLIAAIDEEISRRQDPDDPFDGTASGIFPPLQEAEESPQRTVPKAQPTQIKVDESMSRGLQIERPLQERLVDILSPPRQQVSAPQQNHQRFATLPQGQQKVQQPISDSSQNRTENHDGHEEMIVMNDQPSAPAMTQRQVEESQREASSVQEQQIEDPFRTLRSFHEKQRVERQGENQPRTSVS